MECVFTLGNVLKNIYGHYVFTLGNRGGRLALNLRDSDPSKLVFHVALIVIGPTLNK